MGSEMCIRDSYLGRVEKFNPILNAIIWMDVDSARARARAADKALAKGTDWGPLHGVPMTVKEAFDLAGSPTTWGKPEMKNNIPKSNSAVVDAPLLEIARSALVISSPISL